MKSRNEIERDRETICMVLKKMFSITEDAADNDAIRDRILSGGRITGTNMVVMICAILIASVGLNTDSVAVIIGAMLISPLMGSILAIAYGTAANDSYLIRCQTGIYFIKISFFIFDIVDTSVDICNLLFFFHAFSPFR